MWIVVHDQNGKTALFDPDTRTSVRDIDNARVMSDESLRVDIITVTESLSDLAQLLGAVEIDECRWCAGTGIGQGQLCLTCSGTGKTVQPYSERGE